MKNIIFIVTSLLLFSCGGGGGGGGGGGSTSSGSSSSVVWNSSASSSSISAYKTTEYNNQYGLNSIKAAEAYALLETNGKEVAGNGVTIAVLDSGVRTTHQEISDNYESTHSYDYVNSDSDPTDDHGHGTHVSGIAAGDKDGVGIHGVAYNAGIMAIKVLDSDGNGSYADLIDGINRAANNGAKIINMSLGGTASSSSLKSALVNAKSKDVLSVAATGNESSANPNYPARYASDSDLQGYVLAVGAVDSSNNLYSSNNSCGDAKNYCLVAPGVSVLSSYYLSNVSYAYATGTSMASPHVAGAAAVIRGAWPHLTAAQTAEILLTTATDLGASGVDDVYGHGLLNLEEAVQAQGQDTLSFGASVDSGGYSVVDTSILTDPIFGDAFSVNVANALDGAAFFDSYGRDYKANLGSKIGVAQSRGLNLNSFVFNNIKTQKIPLNFGEKLGFKMNFNISSFDNSEAQNRYGLKYLVVDNSIDPNSYLKNGFSFVSDNSAFAKKSKFGLGFNVDEISSSRSDGIFKDLGFMTQNSYTSNPFQSFFTGSNFSNSLNSLDSGRNFNQAFFGQDIAPNKLSLNFAYQSSYDSSYLFSGVDNKQNELMDLGMNYKLNEDLGMFLSIGKMKEFDNNMLNSKAYGAFESLEDVVTNYAKVSMKYSLAKNWDFLTSYSEGFTKISGNEQGIFRDFSNIRSRAIATALVYHDFYKGSLGFGYQEPLRVYSGEVVVDIATSRDIAGNLTRSRQNVSLVPNGKQQDYEIFYLISLQKDATLNLNLVRQVEPGSIKSAKTNHLGFMQYNKLF